jgi:Cys-tRNA(Pro)/Cys-tRNA(Cys) deacylase
VIILDGDNIIDQDFLDQVNDAFEIAATKAIQTHRISKNRDTAAARMDAIFEEINNAIFRRGHISCGLSAALAGSGTVFDFNWYKTNVMRVLDAKKIAYKSHTYKQDPTMTGVEIAALMHENVDQVFKTLVAQGKSGQYYVFVVPVQCELNLKKAAKAASEKSVSMIKQKELLPLTGYVHGGCSPVGMKKQFETFYHESCL